ncbi:MAG: hypothetical protein LBV43_08330 [Prevotella sp.]|jgi:hypothetical protein|nr:hypothetical protein [Prevotella sp.]
MNPEDAKDKRVSDALSIENIDGLRINDLSINGRKKKQNPHGEVGKI